MHARIRVLLPTLVVVFLLGACQPTWTMEVVGPQETLEVDSATFDALADFVTEVDGQPVLPLERLLHMAGAEIVAEVIVTPEEGASQRFTWSDVAAAAWLLDDGRVELDGSVYRATRVEGVTAPAATAVAASIIDVAPSAAAALGLPPPAQATGRALQMPAADHVMIVLLDAFGYVRYDEALEQGEAPFLTSLPAPLRGVTVYPPVTVVAMGSLLTGSPPEVHGVTRRGVGRTTEVETLFDVAAEAGLRVVAVEGYALAFSMRNAEVHLSGDQDGDGFTEDNVLANALEVVEEGMPDLLFVHFHDIDDVGHSVGPGAPEERIAVARTDAAVESLIEAVPPGTLVFVLADHGMHAIEGGGDHNHLIERDMLIPIFLWMTGEE